MSSTNRSTLSKEERERKKDYYVTPVEKINEFLVEFIKHEPQAFDGLVLDPCAGGDSRYPMSYPTALKEFGVKGNIGTIDIREDSLAKVKGSYLEMDLPSKPQTIITNPPFNIAENVIKKALNDVEDGGFVIMLLRLNFYGGKQRKKFWDEIGLPKYSFVHHRRICFTDDGKTDSIEYAHFVWQKGDDTKFTQLTVL